MIGTPARLVLSATLAVTGSGIFLREAPGNSIPVPITLAAAAQARGGTIKGRVRLTGKSPGNAVIRMGVDPMCGRMNAGKQVVNEQVVVSADGGLANAFVRLQGSFPRTTPPTQPVTIDQRACFYLPRVVGTQVGQTLQVRNSDPMLHNVHSLSNGTNGFNVGQPSAGMVYTFQLKQEEVMLRLKVRRASVDDGVHRRRQPSVLRRERHRRHVRDRERACRNLHDSNVARTIRQSHSSGSCHRWRDDHRRRPLHGRGEATPNC